MVIWDVWEASWSPFGSQGAMGVIFLSSEDYLGAFRVLLDPLRRSLGWLGGHFGDSLVAFVENM